MDDGIDSTCPNQRVTELSRGLRSEFQGPVPMCALDIMPFDDLYSVSA